MVQRLTYRRRHSYNTRSNKVKAVKTPGGRLIYHYVKKSVNNVACKDCKGPISGIPRVSMMKLRRMSFNSRRVNRIYGGVVCARCLTHRILRSFLAEEQRAVRSMLAANKKRAAAEALASAVPSSAPSTK